MISKITYTLITAVVCCLLLNKPALAQTKAIYDKALADSLGADEYGMKKYVLVMLKTGPVTISDKNTTDSLFRGHMDNINQLVKTGKLVVAGPLQKNEKTYRGIFILNVKTLEEAKLLLAKDPAITSGMLDTEMFVWYGSAALPMYLPYSEKTTLKGH
jgi:uncharacterized protein YciI